MVSSLPPVSSAGAARRLDEAARRLAPGYFALVMASGIVSVGLDQYGHHLLSVLLLLVCGVSYAVLVVLSGWRVLAHRDAVRADLADPNRGFGFFTFIAGSNVLGVRVAADGHHAVALVLLAVAGLAWLVLGYVIPWTAVTVRHTHPVLGAADGTWFTWVVAVQSMAVSAATLEPEVPGLRDALAATAVFSWSVGVFLYAAVGVLVAARLLVYDLRATDLTPPYWIAMGATAISVLAGARIVDLRPSPMVEATRGLIAGVAVLLWSFGTWLIPVLVAAGWWRHRVHRVPLVYESSLWAIVFPLGMYAVAGTSLGRVDDLPLVGAVGAVGIWIALAAWVATLLAMLAHLSRAAVRPGADPG